MDPRSLSDRAHHSRLAIPEGLKHDSKSVLPERSNYPKFHTLWSYGLEHCVDMGSVMSKSPQNRSGLKIKPSNQRSDVKRSSIFLYARTSRRWQRRRRRKSTINMRGCSIGTWVGICWVGRVVEVSGNEETIARASSSSVRWAGISDEVQWSAAAHTDRK